jgi:hypothetical protein
MSHSCAVSAARGGYSVAGVLPLIGVELCIRRSSLDLLDTLVGLQTALRKFATHAVYRLTINLVKMWIL